MAIAANYQLSVATLNYRKAVQELAEAKRERKMLGKQLKKTPDDLVLRAKMDHVAKSIVSLYQSMEASVEAINALHQTMSVRVISESGFRRKAEISIKVRDGVWITRHVRWIEDRWMGWSLDKSMIVKYKVV